VDVALGPEQEWPPRPPRRSSAGWLDEELPCAPAARCLTRRPLDTPPVGLSDVCAILEDGRFWTEYQPIVNARNGRTIGFEALGRFCSRDGAPVAPATVFSALRADPALLFRAEVTLKFHQLEHAPDAPLFLNLDPGSWCQTVDAAANAFLGLIASAQRRVVVEITESCTADHALGTAGVVASLRARGFTVALDDLGAVGALLSFEALANSDILKFDRAVIGRLREPRCRALVEMLIRMTQQTGAYTVLEGVERADEFVMARDLGFDFVQGFLFNERVQVARRR